MGSYEGQTATTPVGFSFRRPCMEIIRLSGWYLCTETASQPPQIQSHYLEVKGLTHTSYLSFLLHGQDFCLFFAPHKSA